jgi:hypothetical protein
MDLVEIVKLANRLLLDCVQLVLEVLCGSQSLDSINVEVSVDTVNSESTSCGCDESFR